MKTARDKVKVERVYSLFVGFFSLCLSQLSAAQAVQPSTMNERFEVRPARVVGQAEDAGVEIFDRISGRVSNVSMGYHVVEIRSLYLSGESLFVTGALGVGGLEKLVRVDPAAGAKHFDFTGRRFSQAPNGRWIVYESFYPAHPVEDQVFPSINLVDTSVAQVAERIVFPAGGYGKTDSPVIKKWFLISPVLWKADSSAFCLLSRYGWLTARDDSELHLVTIALANDGQTTISDILVDRNALASTLDIESLKSWDVESLDATSGNVLSVTFREAGKDLVVDIPFSWNSIRE